MSKLSEKIVQEIKEKKIEPKPRWQFLLKDYFIWSSFGVSLLVGSVASSIIFDALRDNDWDVYQMAATDPVRRILIALPLLWMLILALFVVLGYYNYKHTKSGYRNETYLIIFLSVAGSLVIGFSLNHFMKTGEKLETFFNENIPTYSAMNPRCNNFDVWDQPEKGLLTGMVINVAEPNEFDLEDLHGATWRSLSGNVMPDIGQLMAGSVGVKLIGKKESEGLFLMKELRFWKKGCVLKKKKK